MVAYVAKSLYISLSIYYAFTDYANRDMYVLPDSYSPKHSNLFFMCALFTVSHSLSLQSSADDNIHGIVWFNVFDTCIGDQTTNLPVGYDYSTCCAMVTHISSDIPTFMDAVMNCVYRQ